MGVLYRSELNVNAAATDVDDDDDDFDATADIFRQKIRNIA